MKMMCDFKGQKVIFVGDGVNVHKETITQFLGEDAFFAPPQHLLQRASSVAYAALSKEEIDAASLSAIYLRKPQAEREREEKEKNS